MTAPLREQIQALRDDLVLIAEDDGPPRYVLAVRLVAKVWAQKLTVALLSAPAPGETAGWQSLDTAPEDCDVLVWVNERTAIGYRMGANWTNADSGERIHPSHWQPGPVSPPVTEPQAQEESPE